MSRTATVSTWTGVAEESAAVLVAEDVPDDVESAAL
jgi:hypothetical protein